jgi:Tfp pilus assembly protein PilX
MFLKTPISSKPLRQQENRGMVLSRSKLSTIPTARNKQRGVVLFFALLALLAMSLAAVALVRSVDTNTLIAGNLAFKQSATAAGDSGVEQGINWMIAQNINGNVLTNFGHPLNHTDLATYPGYHSDSNLNLFDDATWAAPNIFDPIQDANTGNTIRYLVQRMCRSPNAIPDNVENNVKVPPTTSCVFLTTQTTLGDMGIKGYDETCGAGSTSCDSKSQVPVYRITAKVEGPKGTVSYVQAIAY